MQEAHQVVGLAFMHPLIWIVPVEVRLPNAASGDDVIVGVDLATRGRAMSRVGALALLLLVVVISVHPAARRSRLRVDDAQSQRPLTASRNMAIHSWILAMGPEAGAGAETTVEAARCGVHADALVSAKTRASRARGRERCLAFLGKIGGERPSTGVHLPFSRTTLPTHTLHTSMIKCD